MFNLCLISDYELNTVCTDICFDETLECIASCDSTDSECVSICLRAEGDCYEGKPSEFLMLTQAIRSFIIWPITYSL